jgi:hypothetical protein
LLGLPEAMCGSCLTTCPPPLRIAYGKNTAQSWRFQPYNNRVPVYGYMSTVFDLAAWWTAEHCAIERARQALRLQNIKPSDHDEPFAAVILCTSEPAKGRQAHPIQVVTRRRADRLIPRGILPASTRRAVSALTLTNTSLAPNDGRPGCGSCASLPRWPCACCSSERASCW